MIKLVTIAASALFLLIIPSGHNIQPGGAAININDVVTTVHYLSKHETLRIMSLRDHKNHPIGNSVELCDLLGSGGVLGSGLSYCRAIYRLPHGNIMVQGLVSSRSFYNLAILGGTGIYDNVSSGSLTVSTISINPRRENVIMVLHTT